ncbi:MAG TPA: monovalent cation/H(+) antiporter subunit G [Acidimicrobiia bacterium]|nr:monovalent cation/H(+) antiporter subunit G [Acidimicrobiia bacterium]
MIEVLASILILAGAGLALIAAIGLQRFGDVFARMHVATKPASLGMALALTGAVLAMAGVGHTTKLILVILFQYLTAPISAHLIGRATFRAGTEMHPDTNFDELASRIKPRPRQSN